MGRRKKLPPFSTQEWSCMLCDNHGELLSSQAFANHVHLEHPELLNGDRKVEARKRLHPDSKDLENKQESLWIWSTPAGKDMAVMRELLTPQEYPK